MHTITIPTPTTEEVVTMLEEKILRSSGKDYYTLVAVNPMVPQQRHTIGFVQTYNEAVSVSMYVSCVEYHKVRNSNTHLTFQPFKGIDFGFDPVVEAETELAWHNKPPTMESIDALLRRFRKALKEDSPFTGPSLKGKRRKQVVSGNNNLQIARWNAYKFGVRHFGLETENEVDLSEEEQHFSEMEDEIKFTADDLIERVLKIAARSLAKVSRRRRQKARRTGEKRYTRKPRRKTRINKVIKVKTCNAITQSGSRCTRTQRPCYQHTHINIRRTDTRFIRRINRWIEFINNRYVANYLASFSTMEVC